LSADTTSRRGRITKIFLAWEKKLFRSIITGGKKGVPCPERERKKVEKKRKSSCFMKKINGCIIMGGVATRCFPGEKGGEGTKIYYATGGRLVSKKGKPGKEQRRKGPLLQEQGPGLEKRKKGQPIPYCEKRVRGKEGGADALELSASRPRENRWSRYSTRLGKGKKQSEKGPQDVVRYQG